MKFPVLILNADYLPHDKCDWKEAFIHIYAKDSKACHIVATYDKTVVDSKGRRYNVPAVIVLKEFVKANNRPASFSKGAVHTRDNCTCQYCGGKFSRGSLTIEHVIPQSKPHLLPKGVKMHSFENCVSCCQQCNSRKADRTLKESGMKLRSIPRVITKSQKILLEIKQGKYPKEWEPYIESI